MHITPPDEYVRPFLKWAGGKFLLLPHITKRLPAGKKLIEPFVGGAAVFLNTNYKQYLLADANPDLINLYHILQKNTENFIDVASHYFTPTYNNEAVYYDLRQRFNTTTCAEEKAVLFLYLNRHGFNGLCRYNRSKQFNVPFGRHLRQPYFPLNEMRHFYRKAQQAEFICADFIQTMEKAKKGDVIYCDPPYTPLSDSANFTMYSGVIFTHEHHQQLSDLAEQLSLRHIPVLLSNHNTPLTRKLYKKARKTYLKAARNISGDGTRRGDVSEVLALFNFVSS